MPGSIRIRLDGRESLEALIDRLIRLLDRTEDCDTDGLDEGDGCEVEDFPVCGTHTVGCEDDAELDDEDHKEDGHGEEETDLGPEEDEGPPWGGPGYALTRGLPVRSGPLDSFVAVGAA